MATSVVTGGAGFLGSHLCEYLLKKGHRVVCLDNLDTGSLQNIEHLHDEAFEFQNVDVSEFIDVQGSVDFVFHLASPASPIDYLRLPLKTLKVGSYGTHNALGLAKFKRARFLLASTSEVYGDPLVHPQPEDYWGNVNPIGPRGVYDESKRYSEALTMAYHRQQGVDTAHRPHLQHLRPAHAAQRRPRRAHLRAPGLADKPITIFGDGTQTRSFCYVTDLIDGLFRLATSGEHVPINIGNPTETTLLELADAIIAATGSKSTTVFEALPLDDPKVRRPDTTRASTLLGWAPKVALADGLAKVSPSSAATRRTR